METLFLSCLVGGIVFAIVSVLFGDLLSSALGGALDFLSLDGYHVFNPTLIFSWITVFGGSGILLHRYTDAGNFAVVMLSILIATLLAWCIYFLYVRPMARSEHSIAYSIQELTGAIAEVLVPIPEQGFGEIILKVGAGVNHHIASSFDGTALPAETRVVVVEVDAREGVLLVSKFDI